MVAGVENILLSLSVCPFPKGNNDKWIMHKPCSDDLVDNKRDASEHSNLSLLQHVCLYHVQFGIGFQFNFEVPISHRIAFRDLSDFVFVKGDDEFG